MGQVITRDLGISLSEEEQERRRNVNHILEEAKRRQSSRHQRKSRASKGQNSIDVSRNNNDDEEEDDDANEDYDNDDDDDDEDDEDFDEEYEDQEPSSIDDSYHPDGVGRGPAMVKSKTDAQVSVITILPSLAAGQQDLDEDKKTDQYSRPFQSIQVNKFFAQTDADEEDEHEQDMLNDLSDDDDNGDDHQDQNDDNEDNQSDEKVKRTVHNIRDEMGFHRFSSKASENSKQQTGTNHFASSQLKFQTIFNRDIDNTEQSESEESSQFGAVFTSSDIEEDEQEEQNRLAASKQHHQQQNNALNASTDQVAAAVLEHQRNQLLDQKEESGRPSVRSTIGMQNKSAQKLEATPKSKMAFTKKEIVAVAATAPGGGGGGNSSNNSSRFVRHSKKESRDSEKYQKYLTEFFPDLQQTSAAQSAQQLS